MQSVFFITLLIALINIAYAVDYFHTGSGEYTFLLLTHWKVGSPEGIEAAALPATGDNIYITEPVDINLDFTDETNTVYGLLVIGSGSGGTQKLKVTTNLYAANIEIQGDGILDLGPGLLQGTTNVLVKSGGILRIDGSMNNAGTVKVEQGGKVEFLSGHVGPALTAFEVNGEMILSGATEKKLDPPLVIKAGGSFASSGNGRLSFLDTITVQNDGSFEWGAIGILFANHLNAKLVVKSGGVADFHSSSSITANVENEGKLTFSGDELSVTMGYIQSETNAETIIKESTVTVSGDFSIENGTLAIDGKLLADNVIVGGFLKSAGHSQQNTAKRDVSCAAEVSMITGNVQILAGATMQIDSFSASCHDSFEIDGKLELDSESNLYIRSRDSYFLKQGTGVELATHLSRSGSFGLITSRRSYRPD